MVNGDAIKLKTVDNSIEIMSLSRPDRLNAIDLGMAREINERIVEIRDEESLDGIVITGEGSATCSGLDVDWFEQASEQEFNEMRQLMLETYDIIYELDIPSCIAARSVLIGAGFGIGLSCSFTILGEETRFSFPEVKHGFPISGIGSKLLRQTVGPKVANEIILASKTIEPQRAYDLGLVNAVVPEDDVDETAVDMIRTIAEYDSAAVRESIRNLRP